jgi:hypothetical protein
MFAVEKVTVLARFLEPETIRNNQVILTSLAHCFCHMVGSVEDINSAVAQRTVMFLETIRPGGLKVRHNVIIILCSFMRVLIIMDSLAGLLSIWPYQNSLYFFLK